MQREITTWHLDLTAPQDFRPSRPRPELRIERAEIACPEVNRFFYTAVGGDLFWMDRLSWSHADWMAWLDRPEVETWIGSVAGTPAGYFELERQAEESCEIAYFGLLPRFLVGQGLGGALLSAAVERGWGGWRSPRLAPHLLARPRLGPARLSGAGLPHLRDRDGRP